MKKTDYYGMLIDMIKLLYNEEEAKEVTKRLLEYIIRNEKE